MKFQSIQVLRGFAALSVVLYHIRTYIMLMGGNTHNIFSVFTELFSYAVFLFFAISGFLMAYLIDIGYKNFLIRRLLRIYPIFIIAVFIVLGTKFILLGSVSQPNLLQALSLLPLGDNTYPLGIEWTLVYEIFFYFICAIFATAYLRNYFKYFLILWAGVIVVGISYFKFQTLFLPTFDVILFASFNLFFIMGSLVYYINDYIKNKNKPYFYIALLIAGLLLMAIVYFVNDPSLNGYKKFIYPLVIGSILYSAIQLEPSKNTKLSEYLVKFGDYSYGLYLIHVPIITIFFSLCVHVLHINLASITGIIALVGSLVIGWYFGKFDIALHDYIKTKI